MNEAAHADYGFDFTTLGNKPFKNTRKPIKTLGGVDLYQCTLCKQYKSKEEFYKDKRNPCGIRNRCIKCYHKKG